MNAGKPTIILPARTGIVYQFFFRFIELFSFVNREDLVVLCLFHEYCEASESAGCEVHRFNTIAGFNTGVCLVMANTALATAHNGTTIHDPDEDGFSATLKCHDPNGEIYYVNFARDQISVSSYSNDAILGKGETRADTVTALA